MAVRTGERPTGHLVADGVEIKDAILQHDRLAASGRQSR